jgi:hypothetical protein
LPILVGPAAIFNYFLIAGGALNSLWPFDWALRLCTKFIFARFVSRQGEKKIRKALSKTKLAPYSDWALAAVGENIV